jgi:hypothetical protein
MGYNFGKPLLSENTILQVQSLFIDFPLIMGDQAIWAKNAQISNYGQTLNYAKPEL